MIRPMLAKLQSEPFSDDRYLWEIKYDGMRIVAKTQEGNYSLQARSGKDRTSNFPELKLETEVSAILDGELVCYKDGKLVFKGIQHRATRISNVLSTAKVFPATYEVFDILAADGQDLQRVPLEERKKILGDVLIDTDNVRVAPTFDDGVALFENMQDKHMEGVIGKHKAGHYLQGKREWIKVKAIQSGEFTICGYTKGTGWRTSTFGALVLGEVRSGELVYVGDVGTGFDMDEIRRLHRRMLSLKSATCPFGEEPERATWVTPVIDVLVQYLELTDDGRLRFPSYKGMTN